MLGASVLGAACVGATAQAAPSVAPPMPLGVVTGPPQGFVDFCRRQPGDCGASAAEIAEMGVTVPVTASATSASGLTFDWSGVFAATQARKAIDAARRADLAGPESDPPAIASPLSAPVLPMNRELRALLRRVNAGVNRSIASRPDALVYGVEDLWTTPLEFGLRAGDCEDYVLEKRRALLQAGVPGGALSVAVVIAPRGQGHAVLLVNTDRGEYVLDNLTPWVLPWTEVAYEWRERQVAGSASRWAMAVGAPSDPTRSDTRPGLLLASLR